MNIHDIWRRITATRYTRGLEAEVGRLRAENRALLNSILGIAGVPPITVALPADADVAQVFRPEDVLKPKGLACKEVSYINPSYRGTEASHADVPLENSARGLKRVRNKVPGEGVTPMRRRSWHQIYRMLEIDSARKKPTGLDGQASAAGPQEATNIPTSIVRT
jgi:hypothetical protein